MRHQGIATRLFQTFALLSLLFLTLWPSALFAESTDTANTLIVYSGRAERLINPVIEAFTAKTGIQVELLTSGTAALINRLSLEAERTPADILITNDAGGLEQARIRELLYPLLSNPQHIHAASASASASELDPRAVNPVVQEVETAIPPAYRGNDNSWIGLSGRVYIIVYNTQLLPTPNVQSVLDLAKPRWKGKIAIHHAGSEYLQSGVSVIRAVQGDAATRKFLRGLKENAGNHVYGKSSQIVNAVARGDVALGLVNHYYIYRHLAKHPDAPIAALMPDQDEAQMGALLNVAGVGIVKQTAHPEQAERFVAFLVSEEGQNMFARLNKEFPLRAGVPMHPDLTLLKGMKTASVPLSNLGNLHEQTLTLMESIGMR